MKIKDPDSRRRMLLAVVLGLVFGAAVFYGGSEWGKRNHAEMMLKGKQEQLLRAAPEERGR